MRFNVWYLRGKIDEYQLVLIQIIKVYDNNTLIWYYYGCWLLLGAQSQMQQRSSKITQNKIKSTESGINIPYIYQYQYAAGSSIVNGIPVEAVYGIPYPILPNI